MFVYGWILGTQLIQCISWIKAKSKNVYFYEIISILIINQMR